MPLIVSKSQTINKSRRRLDTDLFDLPCVVDFNRFQFKMLFFRVICLEEGCHLTVSETNLDCSELIRIVQAFVIYRIYLHFLVSAEDLEFLVTRIDTL